jgi:hypothetical protein
MGGKNLKIVFFTKAPKVISALGIAAQEKRPRHQILV